MVEVDCGSRKHREWQESELVSSKKGRSREKCSQPAWMWDVRMACDVGGEDPDMGVDGHVVAALLKEMRDTREVCVPRKLRGQLQVQDVSNKEGRGVGVAAEDREVHHPQDGAMDGRKRNV